MPEIAVKITKAEYVSDYVLKLTFSDGTVKNVDFLPLADRGVCVKLRDLNYFKNFTLDPYTVDWNNEIGFAPEFLYELEQPNLCVAEEAAKFNID